MSHKSDTYQIIFGISLSILPFLILSIFAQPIAEDFGFATQAQKNDFWNLLVNSYRTMNGRYVANIFMYASPMTFNSFIGYKIAPALLILLLFLSNTFLFTSLLPQLNRIKRVAMALGLTALFINGMPIISEGLYWYTGSSIYLTGIILAIVTISTIIKAISTTTPRFANYLITSLFIFLACGFNETQTVFMLCTMAILTIVNFYKKSSHKNMVMLLFFVVIGSGLFMILAPGNTARSNMYVEGTKDILHATSYSLAQLVRFAADWTLSLPFLALTILYIANWNKIKNTSPLIKNGFHLNKWFALLFLFAAIILSVFPAYWFTGILGQHRTLNVGYITFLLLWFIAIGAWLKEHQLIVQKFTPIVRYQKLVMALFIFGLLFTDNGYHALRDLISGEANRFNTELNMRHELLAKTSNKTGVKMQFEPITAKPKCLFVSDITSDPNYWMNLGYNNYFGLDGVPIFIAPEKESQQ